MSDWEELQLAMQHLREAWAGLVGSVKEAFVSGTHPIVESTATVLDDRFALPEPSYPEERKQAMERDREARGE